MNLTTELTNRSGSKCELCLNEESLVSITISPKTGNSDDENIVVCGTCESQLGDMDALDTNHWRCLNESMWSTTPAVQVMSYRLLKSLSSEGWAQDAVNMMYMDDVTMEWAQAGLNSKSIKHVDSNGQVLENGDTVVLIKDLDVKGSSLIAKRGVSVRRIRLVHDNPEHIEGKVEGQTIVILTKFVKKS